MSYAKLLFLYVLLLFSSTIFAQLDTAEIAELNKVKPVGPRIPILIEAGTEYNRIKEVITIASKQEVDEKENKYLLAKSGTSWKRIEGGVQYFQYEEGYEYRIGCDIKRYFDDRPSEYTLTRVYSKKKKKSDIRKEHEKATFEKTTWQFTEFEGVAIDRGFMIFRGTTFSVSVGCNTMSQGKVQIKEQKQAIRFTQMGPQTEMWCSDELIMEQESRLPTVLQSIDNFEATAHELVLKCGDKVLCRLKR